MIQYIFIFCTGAALSHHYYRFRLAAVPDSGSYYDLAPSYSSINKGKHVSLSVYCPERYRSLWNLVRPSRICSTQRKFFRSEG